MRERGDFSGRRDDGRAAKPGTWSERTVRGVRRALVVLAFFLFSGASLFTFLFAGCTGPGGGVGSPKETPTVTAAQAIALHSDSIMAIPGVTGLYEGRTDKGETVIKVMLADRTRDVMRKLPKKLEGYRVEVEESGPIEPMAK